MTIKSQLESQEFWQALTALEQLENPIAMNSFSKKFDVSMDAIHQALYFFHNLNLNFKVEVNASSQKIIVPPKEIPKIKIELKVSEWVSLQAHFPFLEMANKSVFHNTLSKKLMKVEEENIDKDLFNTMPSIRCNLEEVLVDNKKPENHKAYITSMLEQHIIQKDIVCVSYNKTSEKFFVHRIVYLGDELSVIVESVSEPCLKCINITDIKEIEELPSKNKKEAAFTHLEVNDYINGFRSVHESDFRLILKINSNTDFNIDDPFFHLGNPFIVTNHEGDYIWAATVESNESLFKWIESIQEKVSILEPSEFKKEFDEYLQRKNLVNIKKSG